MQNLQGMSFVRLLEDGESNGESEHSNNQQPLSVLLSEAEREMLLHRVIQFVNVGTALETELRSLTRNSGNEILASGSQILKLQFVNQIPSVIFTREKIVCEDSAPIEIALVDGLTGQVVKSGPVAAARVEIVVLVGEFGGTDGHDWTVEEFESKIVKEMSGRKSILIGNVLNLKEGTGLVSELSFTHNSKWMKICTLRLGAKVVGDFNGIIVKEAKTEPFILKDFRATYRNKHDSLSLNDEVWRLKKIGKNGPFHKRLIEANIKTVKDFLFQLSMDPQRFKQMHNGGDRMWAVIVGHACECVIDRKADAHESVVSAFENRHDESELIIDSNQFFIDNEASNSTRVEARSETHLETIDIPLDEIWSALARRKWKVVSFAFTLLTVSRDDSHISKKMRCC